MVEEHPFPLTANQVQSCLYWASQSAIISFLFHELMVGSWPSSKGPFGPAAGQDATVYEVILYTQIVRTCRDGLLCYLSSMSTSMKAVGYREPLPIDHPDSLLDIIVPVPEPTSRDLLVQVKAVS